VAIDVATAAAEYLPTVDALAELFNAAIEKPTTGNELDSV
jgi:hypothetical protein